MDCHRDELKELKAEVKEDCHHILDDELEEYEDEHVVALKGKALAEAEA